MTTLRNTLCTATLLCAFLATAALIAGCKKKEAPAGAFESMGKKVDAGLEETRKAMEESSEEIKSALDDAGKEIKEGVDEAGKQIKEDVEELKEDAEKLTAPKE